MSGFVPLSAGNAWRKMGDAARENAAARDGEPSARGVSRGGVPSAEAGRLAALEASYEARLAEQLELLQGAAAAREAERRAEHDEIVDGLRAAKAAAEAAEARHEEAAARADAAGARLDRAAEGLLAARAAAIAEVREHAAAVILEAARRIAGDALHADPRLLDALVGSGVDALGRAGLTVRAAPVDVDALRARWDGLDVAADPTVAAGCVCLGPAGQVDASLGAAVAAVRDVLDTWRAS